MQPPPALGYRLGRLLSTYGRYPLLLLALSLLFFTAQHAARTRAYITPQILLNAIDADIRALVLAQEQQEGALRTEIDAQLRPLVHPAADWPAAYWGWLSQWDKSRLAVYGRVAWTVLLALLCLSLTLLLARAWVRANPRGWPAKIGAGLLGVVPAYVLVFALADGLNISVGPKIASFVSSRLLHHASKTFIDQIRAGIISNYSMFATSGHDGLRGFLGGPSKQGFDAESMSDREVIEFVVNARAAPDSY